MADKRMRSCTVELLADNMQHRDCTRRLLGQRKGNIHLLAGSMPVAVAVVAGTEVVEAVELDMEPVELVVWMVRELRVPVASAAGHGPW